MNPATCRWLMQSMTCAAFPESDTSTEDLEKRFECTHDSPTVKGSKA